MREALQREYGIPVRWVDSRSRNTWENAANAAQLLAGAGGRRVVLVMHGFDVRRAKRTFEASGLEVIAAPTQIARPKQLRASDFLPDVNALVTVHFALYEFLALARDSALGQPDRTESRGSD